MLVQMQPAAPTLALQDGGQDVSKHRAAERAAVVDDKYPAGPPLAGGSVQQEVGVDAPDGRRLAPEHLAATVVPAADRRWGSSMAANLTAAGCSCLPRCTLAMGHAAQRCKADALAAAGALNKGRRKAVAANLSPGSSTCSGLSCCIALAKGPLFASIKSATRQGGEGIVFDRK